MVMIINMNGTESGRAKRYLIVPIKLVPDPATKVRQLSIRKFLLLVMLAGTIAGLFQFSQQRIDIMHYGFVKQLRQLVEIIPHGNN